MEVSKTNTLSFYNDQGVLTISAKQYDTGRKFIFNIINDYELFDLTGYSVYMRMKKADNTEFQGEECCTIVDNKIVVDTSVGNGDQILSCAGMNLCELHLTDSNGKSITTWNFIINVEARVHNGDGILSENSWDLMDSINDIIIDLKMNKLDKTTVASSSTLGLIKSGTDITVDSSGNVSVNDNSHKHTVSNISDLTATASELNVLDGITATTQELNYVDGVTSNIQTQLNSKSANGHTHDDRYYTESEIDTTVSNINNSISSHISNTSNPHSVTKAQVGLGNVENKSSATIRGEITKSNVTTALGYTPLNQSLKGSASGLAELDSNGKVPSSQLPSFVDDVVEGYLSGGKFYKESSHTTEISGETGKIYIDLSTEKTYRWSGSAFVVISETLALGETSSTAYRGDRGKTAYDHSQSSHAPSNAQANVIETVKVNGTALTPSSKAVDIKIPNSFSNVVVGSTTIAADSFTDTLTLVSGSNVTITPDSTNDKLTISSAHPSISKSTDTTSTASPSAGGTFTAVDSITRDSNGHITKINTKTVTLPSTSVTVDSALSSTSINPVQNKVVTEQITELNNNLVGLEYSDVAGGKNLIDFSKIIKGYELDTGNLKVNANWYVTDYIKVKPNTTYTISGTSSNYVCNYDSNKNYITSSRSQTFTTYNTTEYVRANSIISGYDNAMLEEGTTATPYKPYIPSVKNLAEKTTQIDDNNMLGWVVPKEMPIKNYVDSDGVFHQRVGRIDLGSLDWNYNTSRYSPFFECVTNIGEVRTIQGTTNFFTIEGYGYVSANSIWNSSEEGLCLGSNAISNDSHIIIRDTSYTDATTFKNAMQGVYLYYELAEEITTSVDGNEAVTKVNDSLAVIGKCKNLLNPTLATTTKNGITCTNNGDGTYTLNGTATSNVFFRLCNFDFDLSKKYNLIGCPKGGSNNTYYLETENKDTSISVNKDFGNGSIFIPSDDYYIYICIIAGTTVQNIVFKPMLTTNLNATYYDFVPYTGDGNTLTADVAELKNDLTTLQEDLPNKYLPLNGGGEVIVNADTRVIIGKNSSGITVANGSVSVSNRATASKVELNCMGSADFYGFNGKKVSLSAPAMDNDVKVTLPSKAGTLALKSDIPVDGTIVKIGGIEEIEGNDCLKLVYKKGTVTYTAYIKLSYITGVE